MSREIKFRAWSPTLNKFVCWYQQSLTMTGDTRQLYLLQYTGLKDREGREIYEGDIVRVYENDNGYFEVIFKNDYVGGWVLKNPSHHEWVSLGARKMDHIDVIGNIYENPELLQESV